MTYFYTIYLLKYQRIVFIFIVFFFNSIFQTHSIISLCEESLDEIKNNPANSKGVGIGLFLLSILFIMGLTPYLAGGYLFGCEDLVFTWFPPDHSFDDVDLDPKCLNSMTPQEKIDYCNTILSKKSLAEWAEICEANKAKYTASDFRDINKAQPKD